MARIHKYNAGIPLSGLLQNRLGKQLEGPVGRGRPCDHVDAVLPLPLQQLVGVIAGVLIGIGSVGVKHVLHICVVPALDEAAGVFRVILHGNDAPALYQNRDVLPPAVAELRHLGGIIPVLQRRAACAARQQRRRQQQAEAYGKNSFHRLAPSFKTNFRTWD